MRSGGLAEEHGAAGRSRGWGSNRGELKRLGWGWSGWGGVFSWGGGGGAVVREAREGREGIWTRAKARSSAKHGARMPAAPSHPGPPAKRSQKEKRVVVVSERGG